MSHKLDIQLLILNEGPKWCPKIELDCIWFGDANWSTFGVLMGPKWCPKIELDCIWFGDANWYTFGVIMGPKWCPKIELDCTWFGDANRSTKLEIKENSTKK